MHFDFGASNGTQDIPLCQLVLYSFYLRICETSFFET